eukprot:g8426.t1
MAIRRFEICIIGQGLAGTALAWALRWAGIDVAVIDRDDRNSASRVAAGLITPITGQRFVKSRRFDELYAVARCFYQRVETEVGCRLLQETPMVRLFSDASERNRFQQRSGDEFGDSITTTAPDLDDVYFDSGEGGFEMKGARLDVLRYLDASRTLFQQSNGFFSFEIDPASDLSLTRGCIYIAWLGLQCRQVVFCQGIQAADNPWFGGVPFDAAKGELLTVRIPGLNERRVIHRDLWLFQIDGDLYRAGATYDRERLDSEPTALPSSEKPVHLFNGKDLSGWEGQTKKYFSVKDGIIVAKNTKQNAPKASTYLVTRKKYRNFRLIFEAKLVTSEMHSGIAFWGKNVTKAGDKYSYQGHLVMFPSGYGFYDLYRRNSIYRDKKRVARKAGKQHDWNRMEILAIGNRIRHVINGKLVADWTDPKPEYCQPGPIGLQLHSNRAAFLQVADQRMQTVIDHRQRQFHSGEVLRMCVEIADRNADAAHSGFDQPPRQQEFLNRLRPLGGDEVVGVFGNARRVPGKNFGIFLLEVAGKGRYQVQRSGMTVEGCLAVSGDQLIFPQGRIAPHLFRRSDGVSLGALKNGGGSFVAADGNGILYNGPGNKTGWVNVSRPTDRRVQKTFHIDTEIAMNDSVVVRSSDDRVVVTERYNGALRWRASFEQRTATIVAGDVAFVGGRDRVAALSLKSGKTIWSSPVQGAALGLAVAHQRLYVSTDTGCVYCFHPGEKPLKKVPNIKKPQAETLRPTKAAGISKLEDPTLIGRWVFHSAMNERARRRGLKNASRRVADLAGGRHATVLGELRLQPVGGVEALVLDGRTTSVRIVDDHKVAQLPVNAISAEAWVRVDREQQWGGIVGAFQDNGGFERGWVLGLNGRKFSFGLAGTKRNGRMTYLTAKSDFEPGRWYHVAGTYDGTTQCLYVDGELAGQSRAQKGPIHYPPQAFYEIGAYHDKDEYFRLTGLLHDVRVFRSAQSAKSIRRRYHSERTRFPLPIELAAGPWAQFVRPGTVTVRWRTEQPSPTILRHRLNNRSHRIVEKQLKTSHCVTLRNVRKGEVHSYRIETLVNGKTGVTPRFELDPHFDFTLPDVAERIDVFPRDANREKAARIVKELRALSPHRRGMCLVLGAGNGAKIWELICSTRFHLVVVETDRRQATRVRNRLTRAGVYGSRVTVHHVSDDRTLPFCGAFANWIVVPTEKTGKAIDAGLDEWSRQLRPNGGTALFRVAHESPPLSAATKQRLGKLNITGKRIRRGDQSWLVLTRGQIEGGGEWSHLYGRPDNSAFGGESLGGAKSISDLRVQWIGRPGPRAQADRNGRKPSPLSKNGRLFMQGLHRLIAIDAYNGTILWSLEIPTLERFNMPRDSSNWCVDDDAVFVAIKDRCFQIDAETGQVARIQRVLPGSVKDWKYDWSYIARVGESLIGSGVKKGTAWTNFWGKAGDGWYDAATGPVTDKVCSENLFAVDPKNGQTRWSYSHGVVLNSTITAANGRISFVECRNPKVLASVSRRVGMPELWKDQFLVALDSKTGSKIWEKPLKTSAGVTAFWMAAGKDRLVITASGTKNYDVYAYDSATGQRAWHQRFSWPGGKSDHGKALSRPAIVGEKLIVRPKMFHLKTGVAMAGSVPHGGCGTYAATTRALIYRNSNITMWDAEGDFTRGGGPETTAAIFITPQARVVVTNNVDSVQIFERDLAGLGFQLKQRAWHEPHVGLLEDLCRGRIVASDTGFSRTNDISVHLSGMRLPLTEPECNRARRLGRRVAHAVEATARHCQSGQTEADIAAEVAHRLIRHLAVPVRIQVAGDGRAERYRHWSYGSDPVRKFCTISAIAQRDGLCLGVSRTFSFGEAPTSLHGTHSRAMLMQATGMYFSQGDWELFEVWKRVKRIYEKFGFADEWQNARQAEIIGYEVTEIPVVPKSEFRLAPQMMVYWHPTVGAAAGGDSILVFNTPSRIPLRKLISMKQYPREMQQVLVLYAEGYSLAEYLVQNAGKKVYLEFLNDAERIGWDRAIKKHYNVKDVESLEKHWNRWVMAGSPRIDLQEGEQLAANRRPARNPDAPVIRSQSPDVKSDGRRRFRQPVAELGDSTLVAPDPKRSRRHQTAAIGGTNRDSVWTRNENREQLRAAGRRATLNAGWVPVIRRPLRRDEGSNRNSSPTSENVSHFSTVTGRQNRKVISEERQIPRGFSPRWSEFPHQRTAGDRSFQ